MSRIYIVIQTKYREPSGDQYCENIRATRARKNRSSHKPEIAPLDVTIRAEWKVLAVNEIATKFALSDPVKIPMRWNEIQ